MPAHVCSGNFLYNGPILPLTAYATIATAMIIAITFMFGRMLANAKLTLWAKTEAIQIVISVLSVFFLIIVLNIFCSIDMGEVADAFGIYTSVDTEGVNMYYAAEEYLVGAAKYSHNAMTATRYHLEAYTIFAYLNAFECDFSTGSIGWGCLFGYSGENLQPLGGYGAKTAALNVFFNSTIISYFSALNSLFILTFVYKGLIFLLLPLGIFMRAMPYMRSFGALLISLAIAFVIIYPFMLSVLYLMGDVLLDRPAYTPEVPGVSLDKYYNEEVFSNNADSDASSMQSFGAAFAGADYIADDYFPSGDNLGGVLAFDGYAFIAAVFMPSIALLATIASVGYIARLYGDEIDLSRITRLV